MSSSNASRVISTSPGSSSTSRTSIGADGFSTCGAALSVRGGRVSARAAAGRAAGAPGSWCLRRVEPDAAAVVLDDLLAQGQADAGAGVLGRGCRRWKMTKTCSAYSGSMPMPLSATERPIVAVASARCRDHAARWSPRNLRALLMRFWKSGSSSGGSPGTVGRSSTVIAAGLLDHGGSRLSSRRHHLVQVDDGSRLMRPTRENASRSLIRSCIRLAPSTAKSMYWSARSSSWPA